MLKKYKTIYERNPATSPPLYAASAALRAPEGQYFKTEILIYGNQPIYHKKEQIFKTKKIVKAKKILVLQLQSSF